MKLTPVDGPVLRRAFDTLPRAVYAQLHQFRSIGLDYAAILLSTTSAFSRRCASKPYLILDDAGRALCRFILCLDSERPEAVMLAAFEALSGLEGAKLRALIREAIRSEFPQAGQALIGLNGHLNYGAGFLLNRFEEVPLFDTNYNPPYYHDYFPGFRQRLLLTYAMQLEKTVAVADRIEKVFSRSGISIRPFKTSRARAEIELYTQLNNACFAGHEFWTERKVDEDWEMFEHSLPYIEPGHYLLAEKEGKPIGFLLWLPDYNRACSTWAGLPLSLRWKNKAKPAQARCRLYEIAVLPEERRGPALALLMASFARRALAQGYNFCEGGFILDSNQESLATARRYSERSAGYLPEPHRQLAFYQAGMEESCWN